MERNKERERKESKEKERTTNHRAKRKKGKNEACYFEARIFGSFNLTGWNHQLFGIVENVIDRPDVHLPAGTEKL